MDALNDWLSSAEITTGPIFRRMGRGGREFLEALTPFSIRQVVKRYVESAGLDPAEFGGQPPQFRLQGSRCNIPFELCILTKVRAG